MHRLYTGCAVAADHGGSHSGPAYLYSNGGPGVPYALPNGIALYCTTDGNSYLVPAAQQQVSAALNQCSNCSKRARGLRGSGAVGGRIKERRRCGLGRRPS